MWDILQQSYLDSLAATHPVPGCVVSHGYL